MESLGLSFKVWTSFRLASSCFSAVLGLISEYIGLANSADALEIMLGEGPQVCGLDSGARQVAILD